MILEKDKWLSQTIGIASYMSKTDTIEEYMESKPTSISSPYFITVKSKKSPTLDFKSRDKNIKFITSMNNYMWYPHSRTLPDGSPGILEFDLQDFDQVMSIGKNAFEHDRFNLDKRIDKNLAIKIKQSWLQANLLRERETKTLIYKLPSHAIIGFNSLLVTNKFLTIDLIAVNEQNRGQGIASKLVRASQIYAQGLNLPIKVGTQQGNIANKLYSSNGFVLHETLSIFHDLIL
jgi:ribosomal protein S18 acetylase RimI-like enzyme